MSFRHLGAVASSMHAHFIPAPSVSWIILPAACRWERVCTTEHPGKCGAGGLGPQRLAGRSGPAARPCARGFPATGKPMGRMERRGKTPAAHGSAST